MDSTVTPNTAVAVDGDASRAASDVDSASSDVDGGGVIVDSTRTLAALRVTLIAAGVMPPPK